MTTQVQKESFSSTSLERTSELAAIAVAAAAKAEVESAYVMALKRPRNEDDARIKIKNICGDPDFAEKAKYQKPVSGKIMEGPSIRFAEEMIRHWGNVKTMQNTIYEDENKRIVKLTVIDLESNISYSKEIGLEKTVERRDSKGRDVLGERTNTGGQKVYIVRATEDEMMNKEAAAVSKVIRNNGLRLIPQHIIEAAMDAVDETLKKKVNSNPEAEKQKVMDAFSKLGIMPSEIEKYLGHSVKTISPAEVVSLRGVYTTIKEGSAKWADYLQVEEKKAELTEDMLIRKTSPAKSEELEERLGE